MSFTHDEVTGATSLVSETILSIDWNGQRPAESESRPRGQLTQLSTRVFPRDQAAAVTRVRTGRSGLHSVLHGTADRTRHPDAGDGPAPGICGIVYL